MCDALGVPSELALDLPRAHRAAHEGEPGDAAGGLLIVRLVVAHVVMQDRDDVVLSVEDRAGGEGELRADVVCAVVHCADGLVVDPH